MSSHETRRVFLFTHSDLDGFGCDYVVRAAFSGCAVDYKSYVCSYTDIDDQIMSFLEREKALLETQNEYCPPILLTSDIIPTRPETLEALETFAARNSGMDSKNWKNYNDLRGQLGGFATTMLTDGVLVMDHHEAALKAAEKYPWVYADQSKCGTTIALKVFNNVQNSVMDGINLRRFCQLVEIYDLWKINDVLRGSAERLNALFYFWGYHEFMRRMLHYHCKFTFCEAGHWSVDYEGELAYRLQARDKAHVRSVIEKSKLEDTVPWMDHDFKKYFIVVEDRMIGEVGDQVLDMFPDVDYVVIVSVRNNQLSFRSRGDTNVTELAQIFGGGGHPSGKVSGAPFPNVSYPMLADIAHEIKERQMGGD